MKLKAVSIALCAIILTSCSNDEPSVSQDYGQVKTGNPYKVPLEEALAKAEIVMSDISTNPLTRATKNVASVEIPCGGGAEQQTHISTGN